MTFDDVLTPYLQLLAGKGWTVEEAQPGEVLALRPEVRARYARIPEQYERFLARVRSCVNADETIWFLCAEDYNVDPADPAFAWNEFEKMELEDLAPGAAEAMTVRQFWDAHLPFMLSVGGEYSYMGFRVVGERFGSVVEGYDIDLREPSDVARDFEEFARLHSKALNGDAGGSILGAYA